MLRSTLLIPLLCAAPFLRAAETSWLLTTADFSKRAVTITALDGKNLTATERDRPVAIPIEHLLRLDRDAAPADTAAAQSARFTLWLSNGDKLTGEPGDLK